MQRTKIVHALASIIDLVAETSAGLVATECKWAPQDAAAPSAWRAAYPQASFRFIHRGNYLESLLGE